jgi:predicted ArsR family transcriptional regulator
VISALCELGTATGAELSQRSHSSERTVRRHLQALTAAGLVRELPTGSDGETPGRPARRFALQPRVRRRAAGLFALLSRPLGP